eukprot:12241283-Alexandrium_andersonii.AAC.1
MVDERQQPTCNACMVASVRCSASDMFVSIFKLAEYGASCDVLEWPEVCAHMWPGLGICKDGRR